jgi:hypothetical protein
MVLKDTCNNFRSKTSTMDMTCGCYLVENSAMTSPLHVYVWTCGVSRSVWGRVRLTDGPTLSKTPVETGNGNHLRDMTSWVVTLSPPTILCRTHAQSSSPAVGRLAQLGCFRHSRSPTFEAVHIGWQPHNEGIGQQSCLFAGLYDTNASEQALGRDCAKGACDQSSFAFRPVQ